MLFITFLNALSLTLCGSRVCMRVGGWKEEKNVSGEEENNFCEIEKIAKWTECGEIFNLLKCITLQMRCELKIDFPQLILDSHK